MERNGCFQLEGSCLLEDWLWIRDGLGLGGHGWVVV